MERKGNNSRINNSLNQHHLLSLQSRVSIIISQGTLSMMTPQVMIVLMIMQFKDYKLVEDHSQATRKNKKKEWELWWEIDLCIWKKSPWISTVQRMEVILITKILEIMMITTIWEGGQDHLKERTLLAKPNNLISICFAIMVWMDKATYQDIILIMISMRKEMMMISRMILKTMTTISHQDIHLHQTHLMMKLKTKGSRLWFRIKIVLVMTCFISITKIKV